MTEAVTAPVTAAARAPSLNSSTAAAVPGSVPRPFVIAVDSMPSGGWLQETQVFGTLFIALIAAGIAGTIQWRQMKIADGARKTAANKLTLDLFDKRLDVTFQEVVHPSGI